MRTAAAATACELEWRLMIHLPPCDLALRHGTASSGGGGNGGGDGDDGACWQRIALTTSFEW